MKKKYIYWCFILFLLFTGVTYFIKYHNQKETNYLSKSKLFTEELHKKELLLNSLLERAIDELKTNTSISDAGYYKAFYKKNEIALIISKNDSVIYWSSNSVPVEDIIVDTLHIAEIFHLSNGWYEVREKRYKDYLVRGAILIKSEYGYQNDYLKNEFQKGFSLPDNCEIQLVEGEYNVFSSEGYLLCSLMFKNIKAFPSYFEHINIVCFILSYIFFISFLIIIFSKVTERLKYQAIWVVLISILIIILRFCLFKFRIPGYIYSLDFFSPKYYANSTLLPSLGDLLLNILTVFIIIVFIFKNFRKKSPQIKVNTNIFLRIFISAITLLFIPILFSVAFYVIKGIVLDSSLIFDLNNIFSLDFYSIIGLFTVSLLLLSLFLLTYMFAETAFRICNLKLRDFYIALSIGLLCFAALNFYFSLEWINFFGLIIIYALVGFYLKKNQFRFTVQAIAFYIIMFSLLSTYCFYKYDTFKEKEKRILLATQLSMEEDPIAEYLFSDVEKKITADTTIRDIINSNANIDKEAQIKDILKKNYLNGYWERYGITVIVCQPGQELNIKPDNIKTDCDTFFKRMIDSTGIATMNPDLFFLNNGSDRNSYIARIPFFKGKADTIPELNLYLQLDSKYVDKEMGYPELLIDKDIKINRDIYNYSYAKYKNNQLLLQYGKYYYSLNADSYGVKNAEYSFFEKDNYDHLYYKINPKSSIIISKPKDTLLYMVAPFSYIFIFYCICVLAFLLVIHLPLKKREMSFNFKTRIQISMVMVLIASFVVIGLITLNYLISLNNKKNIEEIGEKTHSVLIDIEDKLGNVQKITPEMKEDIEDMLTRMSNTFFTDINIYTPGGLLVASSRPQVFDEGMLSRKMDAEAFGELSTNKKMLYIHEENIGKLNYISAYMPFSNNSNEVAGYINLPYFAKQSDLKKEISTFLIAFININVILTALAIIIALLVSNYITRPMKLIKEKIGKIKLGKKNERINWNKDDEIGGLISEYNRMVDELTESAELLARSERESAWREMAKQVAHEIKNPLTPMKLSVQHLQKAWEEKTPDWDVRIAKFTKTMIEQIESLNKIASEFSDFAKMPRTNNETIDIVELLENTVALFQDSRQSITIIKPENEHCKLFADKTQILRIFNNLLKNSLQAISNVKNGKIEIIILKETPGYQIRFIDNGIGIPEEQKEKIFSPNFTTKTGGTGLGLAMVKSIVESYSGKIWFESETEKGTTFYIELPAAE